MAIAFPGNPFSLSLARQLFHLFPMVFPVPPDLHSQRGIPWVFPSSTSIPPILFLTPPSLFLTPLNEAVLPLFLPASIQSIADATLGAATSFRPFPHHRPPSTQRSPMLALAPPVPICWPLLSISLALLVTHFLAHVHAHQHLRIPSFSSPPTSHSHPRLRSCGRRLSRVHSILHHHRLVQYTRIAFRSSNPVETVSLSVSKKNSIRKQRRSSITSRLGNARTATSQPEKQDSQSEELLRLIVEASPSAMLLIDKLGSITLVNAQTEHLFGHRREDLLGKSVEMLIPSRFRVRHRGYCEDFFTHPDVRPMGAGRELYGLRADGTEFPIEIGLNPMVINEERMVIASVIDITKRKQGEQHLRLVIDATPMAMVIVDCEGIVRLANATSDKLFGAMPSRLIGERIETLIPERFRAQHPNFRHGFSVHRVTRPMGTGRNLYARRLDGTELPVEIGLSPLETEEGRFVIASIIDTTERQRNERLQAQVDVAGAEAASRAKNDFLAMMSHELRTPLTGILGMIELLRSGHSTEERETLMNAIQCSSNSLLTVISDILDFTKIEAGHLSIENIDFELTSKVDMVIQPFIKVALDKGLRLNYIGPDSSAAPFIVRGDPTRLRQIIVNLVENAIKFTKTGEIEVGVCAPEHDDSEHWRFFVRDTGVGIEEMARKKLFEPFVQADQSITRKFGGTGLGLAICRRLVVAMGGEIGVQSTVGAGSTFWFTLPLRKGDATVLKRCYQLKCDPLARTLHPLKILVAEDNEIIQALVGKMLERMGHRAVCVGDGYTALQAVKHGSYDLVLIDMHMPIIDGAECTRRIRQLDGDASRIPVIALTADAILDHHKRYIEAGVEEVLTKPIDLIQLRTSLDRIEQAITGKAAFDRERVRTLPDAIDEDEVKKSFGSFVQNAVNQLSMIGDVSAVRAITVAEATEAVQHSEPGTLGRSVETLAERLDTTSLTPQQFPTHPQCIVTVPVEFLLSQLTSLLVACHLIRYNTPTTFKVTIDLTLAYIALTPKPRSLHLEHVTRNVIQIPLFL
ncbi:uncharacterized protein BDR25DRAFT_397219 [Lindgomyces ingoldianus]|uniref:Uncharacterized protein n=1 Tax=Lindgomyces ingoldianus TaxID=673940 RepID=A0ACB6QB85_9PLEO|nr:uncharacterized protein BDR25DRAFT_397219 [Lindgomyces ingoldianus]KAF2463387.1 hypothetical protein BDR25DRAFT_397219 [Lindgomyces ingoldianus]